jgi:hypothetical protein
MPQAQDVETQVVRYQDYHIICLNTFSFRSCVHQFMSITLISSTVYVFTLYSLPACILFLAYLYGTRLHLSTPTGGVNLGELAVPTVTSCSYSVVYHI